MGKQKKYAIKTVNLGEAGHPARILSDMFVKKHGNQEFSTLIRKLIIIFLSDNPDFKDWKTQTLIHERKELGKSIKEISDKLCKNAKELEKLGVDINDVRFS